MKNKRYTLWVFYNLESFFGHNQDVDAAIRQICHSHQGEEMGSGSGCGQADISWYFPSREKARDAVKELKSKITDIQCSPIEGEEDE